MDRQRAAEGMATVLRNFADTAEAAVANHRRPKGGMQVPYHDDFSNVNPSTVARLEWWAWEMRAALSAYDQTAAETPTAAAGMAPEVIEAAREVLLLETRLKAAQGTPAEPGREQSLGLRCVIIAPLLARALLAAAPTKEPT